tara:strand:+ start:3300 stop:3584 length:285 start_codon:yes stop_codon:yes gene_type:complete
MPVINKRKKVLAAKQLAEYFRKVGKILTWEEYCAREDLVIRANTVVKYFRGYHVMLKWLPIVDSTIEADLTPKPKAAPKPKTAPKVKTNDSKNV